MLSRHRTGLLPVFLAAATFAAGVLEARTVLYAAAGPELTVYAVSTDGAALTKGDAVTVPENIQEAWPHPSRRYLYVAWSSNSGGSGGHHGITAFRVDPATGTLREHGKPAALTSRPVFITSDIPGKFVIAAYNNPSRATVHRIQEDGTLGAEVPQPAGLDFAVYAHQVRVAPSNAMVVIPARGNVATPEKPEDPGAIQVYAYRDGVLANRASVRPDGGRNFQPRHIDFHPTLPFAYATIEAQNLLHVYRITAGPSLSPSPAFSKTTLLKPGGKGQATSAIHVHPNGRFVYLGNRGPAGGENSIAVYSIDARSGEPTLIQNADTQGAHPRTFTLDPTGRLLVAANMQRSGNHPVSLSVFRIGGDGKLTFVRKYDQPAGDKRGLFWTGMLELPN